MNVRRTKITRSGSMSSGIDRPRRKKGERCQPASSREADWSPFQLLPCRRRSRNQRKFGCRRQTRPTPCRSCLSELSQPLKNHRDETLARSLFARFHSRQIPPNYARKNQKVADLIKGASSLRISRNSTRIGSKRCVGSPSAAVLSCSLASKKPTFVTLKTLGVEL